VLTKELLEFRLYSDGKSTSSRLLLEDTLKPFRGTTIPEEELSSKKFVLAAIL